MNLRTSFRGKLLLLSIVPLAVAQVVTLMAVMRTVEQDVLRRATESLTIGSTVVNEFLASRGEQLRTSVQVLSADFGLKEAVAMGDAETMVSVLRNHSQRVGADIALFLDLNGHVLASTDSIAATHRRMFLELVDDENGPVSRESTVSFGNSSYHTLAVPLRAPIVVGWVVMGFRLDEDLSSKIASLTGLDVTLLSDAGRGFTIAGSNPAGTGFDSGSAILNSVYTETRNGDDWLALRTPFIASNTDVQVELRLSMQSAMAPYLDARRGLALFAALLLIFVALTAAWVSGGIARPLRVLTEASRRMISGRYDRSVSVPADDEFSELAESFNAMQTAIAEREQRIVHQATHDAITDLPNRENILQSLCDIVEQGPVSSIAVISIRLSGINRIASTLGFSASDEVTKKAARLLRLNLESNNLVGHIGSSDFLLVLPDCDHETALAHVDRIANILSTGVTLGRVNVTLTTDTGIAMYPQHAGTAEDLLRNSSIARTESQVRQEPVVTYEIGREDHYVRQLRIVSDLRAALQKDQIQVHYQPKVTLPDGRPCGVEALVRWQHPELGWLSPDDFIPAAEQAGTIVHVTRFVLAKAIEQCRTWQDQGSELQVSVNLSARDLQDEYLPYYVLQLLKEFDIEPARLTLEVTENTVIQEVRHAITVLECLRDIGVSISIDDFGTGHSSLAQLKIMPIHELKIDKSFVMSVLEDKQNQAIVKTTIELAHYMQLRVVAEGVEDDATLRYLAEFGCEQAQGYYLSRPVPPDELLTWLAEWKSTPIIERRSSDRAFQKKA